ncbi:hypothetical protein Tco_0904194 [Tanacetum coccineum]
MVIEGEVLNDFLRFVGVLIAEFATGNAVNLALKMKRDMIIKKLDLKPTIDAMMRKIAATTSRFNRDAVMKENILDNGWVVYSDVVVRSSDAILVFVVTASRYIGDAAVEKFLSNIGVGL